MKSRILKFAAVGSVMLLVAACGSRDPGAYDSSLNQKTAGAAVISSFAKMCGVGGIQQYRQSFVNLMRQQRPLNAEAEARIWEMFAFADRGVAERFPTLASRQQQCSTYGTGEDNIRRGIAGDFRGQI